MTTPQTLIADVTTSPQHTDVNKASTTLNAFMPWVLVLGGSVCNILAILGMRTSKFRSLSTSVFMVVASCNDLFSLNILLTAHWLHLNFPDSIDRGAAGTVLCKFFNFYGWGQADFGIILMSAMTADRAYAIMRPMTTVDLVKRAKIVTVICVGLVALKNFHFWFTSIVVAADRKDRLCDIDYNVTSYENFYVHYWPWIDIIFITVCFVVIVVSNSVIINHVRKNRKGRELQTTGKDKATKKSIYGSSFSVAPESGAMDVVAGECGPRSTPTLARSESTMTIHGGGDYENVGKQVTRMLLAESIAFILLSLPFSVVALIGDLQPKQDTDPDRLEAIALAFNVVFYLLYANKCVNFLVYCMAGKRFRKAILTEVLPMLRRPLRCGGSGDGGFCLGKRQNRHFDSDCSQRTRSLGLDTDRGKTPDAAVSSSTNQNSAKDAVP